MTNKIIIEGKDSKSLLNSEGDILICVKIKGETLPTYAIFNREKILVDILNEPDMQRFIHGEITISDENIEYNYASYPGSMKPDLKELDAWIGIDVSGIAY